MIRLIMKNLFEFILVFALFTSICCSELQAQSALDAMYTRITTYDGLSSNSVNQTVRDNNGYIYFATSNGLDRFDGKNFKSYKHEAGNNKSLSHNKASCLLVDNKDQLWVGTSNGLNLKTNSDTFISFLHDEDNTNSISNNRIETITQDHKGRIWVGTENGLNLYNPETNTFHEVVLSTDKKGEKEKVSILALYEDRHHQLWISCWNKGLTILDLDLDDIQEMSKSVRSLNHEKHYLSNNSFANIFEDGNDRMWAQQFNGHLFQIDYPAEKEMTDCTAEEFTFLKAPVFLSDASTYNCNIYSSLHIDTKGLYLNTNKGLIYVEEKQLENHEVNTVRNNFDKMNDFDIVLPNGNDIYEDNNGILWISTNNGVFKYYGNLNAKFEKNLETYCQENEITIISFHEDGTNLWLGTDNGLYIFDQINNKIAKVDYRRQGYETLNGIWDMEVEGNRMWLGTIAGILYYIDDISQAPYTIQKLETPGLEDQENNNHIWQIEYIDEDKLFLATHKGVFIYNPMDDTSKFYETSNLPYVNGDNIFDIVKDRNGRIWASVTGHGLFELIWRGDSLFFDYKKPESGNSPEEVIFDLEIDDENIWIANISGIQKYNISENKFYSNELLDNTITNQVLGIAAQDNEIVFVTADGLYSYNENDNKLKFNNSLDGVVSNSAIMGIHKSESGNIYLGGTNGYNVLSDQVNVNDSQKREVIFTDLKLSSESVIVNKVDDISDKVILTDDIQSTTQIDLSHKHKFITLNFGVLDYLNPHQYAYSYYIEGLDEEWKELGNRQSISLTNLTAGDYNLIVKGKDKFNKEIAPAQLSISVSAPFWQRAWFILACILFYGLLLKLLVDYKQRIILKQKKKLKRIVTERTQELIAKNEKLEQYIESNVKLEQFAHAASHDLKSPMRTISSYIGLLRMKLKGRINDKEAEYFDYIETGTQRLNNLVGDMLEFAKIKSENINLEQVSGPQLIDGIIKDLEYNIQEKKAIVNVKNIPQTLTVDRLKFSRVIQNLICNALKFVEPGKVPIVTIQGLQTNKETCISIKDNGIGISAENQDKIFDIFCRVAHSESYDGTGMGLAISKKIIESHDGQLTLESTFGKGSEFKVQLPVIRTDALHNKQVVFS